MFESVCTLALCFNMSNMKKIFVLVFYNCFICNENTATNCLKQNLDTRNVEQDQCINDSQAYTINSLLPYAYRHIEEKGFAIKWICELFDVHIYICNTETKDIFLRFCSLNTCSKIMYIMYVSISTYNAHLTNDLINLNTNN